MKKNLFILAVAGLALASCSSDETIATSQASNEISFRALTNGMTRAADITAANDLKSFNVYAFHTSTTTAPYFSNVPFVGPTTYNSEQKYYWPDYNLDFYAWSANSVSNENRNTDVTATDYKSYTVAVQNDADNQADFIYASKQNVAKTTSVTALDFAHKESRVTLSVKNTSANLRFDIVGWRIGYAAPSGSTTNGGTAWTPASAAATNVFTANESKTVNANTTSASAFTKAQIMIPQSMSPVTAYASSDNEALVNNAYIAVKYKAQNTVTDDWVVGSGSTDSEIWGIWPIAAITWEPGKQYNYTLDIAEGGYHEQNQNGTDSALDPIFESFINFSAVTITDWTIYDSDLGTEGIQPIDVTMP